MDLWIRSQNGRNLCKADSLFVRVDYAGRGCILNNGVEIGCYDTEKRAFEVLEMIQQILDTNILVMKNIDPEGVETLENLLKSKIIPIYTQNDDNVDIKRIPCDCMVYQMPKE